jgi:subtilisin-like proprotein convertase family protein
MSISTGFRMILFFFILTFGYQTVQAQLWWPWQEPETLPIGAQRYIRPIRYRVATLDVAGMQKILSLAPLEFTADADQVVHHVELPNPDGGTYRYQIVESPMMDAALQAKHSEIRCYTGFRVDDASEKIRCDITPQGFHAMITGADGKSWFVDPYSTLDRAHYTIYHKADYKKDADPFVCHTDHDVIQSKLEKQIDNAEFAGDCQFRIYRLALACTGEYAAFHGGTVPLALAAMNTSMNRINGVLEREISARLIIIAGNSALIYLNGATDPYTNDDAGLMLDENQTNVDNVIGANGYDLGHVFSSEGGGVAGLGVICSSNSKARGVTGSSQPIGDPFDIDYVIHEMGHQLGANHTFYNSCDNNINNSTAFEPGSGNTIMSYAGICSPNVQQAANDYYHAASLQEIANELLTSGNSCGSKMATGNSAPTVEAGLNYMIPGGTPFALTAVGSDPNSANVLTYCWEQMNNDGAFVQPPVPANAGGPMFRSYAPVPSPTRVFPRLPNQLNNTVNLWESLPSVSRTLNFRVTVRDNAIPAGCTAEDNMVVTVTGAAGPFKVTSPNTNVAWYVGEQRQVTWAVAGTDLAPINTALVKVVLSTDGGLTFPTVLADNIPNNGSATVSVPNQVSGTCRVKVEAKNNIYYDINDANFSIQAPLVPTFVLVAQPSSMSVCPGQTLTIQLGATGLLGFSSPVQLNVAGLPQGVIASYSTNPVSPGGSSTITLSGFTSANAGALNLVISGNGGNITQTTNVFATAFAGLPGNISLVLPANNATGISSNAGLKWLSNNQASTYQVQLASNVTFAVGAIVKDETVGVTNTTVTGLNSSQVYFWRVRGLNNCGAGPWSSYSAFQTASCQVFSNFTPVNIPTTIATITSNLQVSGGTLSDMTVGVNIEHAWIGDISANLRSPSGVTVSLFNRPGVPAEATGCQEDNIIATFDDKALLLSSDFESTCGTSIPAITGTYQPIQALSAFVGAPSTGIWTLSIIDSENNDGGRLANWNLNVCSIIANNSLAVSTNQVLTVPQNQTGTITTNLLNTNSSAVAATAIQYSILVAPVSGTIKLNGNTLGLGGMFTQNDINSGLLVYQHAGGSATNDEFRFQVTEVNGSGWVSSGTFKINIVLNSLSATAAVTQNITCFNQNNGTITVSAQGGVSLTYAINGGGAQSQNVFSNLSAGNYVITVRDNNGFMVTTNSVTISNPQDILVNAQVNGSTLTVTASGGTGALLYSLNGGAAQGSGVFSNLANGAYTCTIKDANGCVKTIQALVAVNSLVAGASVQSNITCVGANNGSINASVAGGQAPFSYLLSGQANPVTGIGQSNYVFSNLAPGSYTVTIRDAAGFSQVSGSVTLTNPAAVQLSASVSGNQITLSGSGGTGALLYSINNGIAQSSPIFTNLANGTYTCQVRDVNGCSATAQATVSVNNLVASATVQSQITCAGLNNGSIVVNVTGGNQPYIYTLSNGVVQSIGTFTNLVAGNYTISVRDAQGFTQTTNPVQLSAPNPIVASTQISQNIITAQVTGGSAPYRFALNGGTYQSQSTFFVNSNGTYTITVQDANGCIMTASAVVAVPALTANASANGSIACFGQSSGQITASAQGGLAPYTYKLSNGASQNTPVFGGLGAGSYTIEVRDAFGGIVTTNAITITQPTQLSASATTTSNSISINAAGGTTPYLYRLGSGANQNSPVFGSLALGNYTVVTTDANGCSVQVSASINPQGIAGNAQVSGIIKCFGEKTITVTATTTGGVPPYTYRLNGGAPQSSNVFGGLGAGAYTVLVTDSQGVTATFVAGTVTEPNQVTAAATASGMSITVLANGGTAPYQYSINGSASQSSPTFGNLAIGSYTIVITDSNGCTVQVSAAINPAGVSGNASISGTIKCAGEKTITVTATINGGVAPYTYRLNGGAAQPSGVFANLGAGTYSVLVTDSQGVTATFVAGTVTEPNILLAGGTVSGATATAQASGGTAPYLYSLNGGASQSSPTFSNLAVGTYSGISVTDANGCTTKTAGFSITVGVQDLAERFGLTVSPNPSSGVFQLELQDALDTDLTIGVYDILGRTMINGEVLASGQTTTMLDMQHLSAGTYLLRVRTSTQAANTWLMIQR